MEDRERVRNKVIKLLMLVSMLLLTTITIGFKETASAYSNEYKFDFGNRGVQSGYIGVSAKDGYISSRGYGFNNTANVVDVNASGRGELSDAVQFKSTSISNTFNVNLDKGLYEVTVYLGNTNRTSIWAEGCLQVINMTGNNANHTFQIPVTDGQVNIMATEGKKGYEFTMSALNIKKISDNPTMKPTIWLCGDSTVCNYYPLDSSKQAGWGQVLNKYIDNSRWEVRNMASSGQYAKGFLNAGQFATISKYGKQGDIFFISIGINDTNYSNASEYHDSVYKMAKEAKDKGMQVILVKQQGRSTDMSRKPLLTGRWFGGELDKVGSELNLQVIDLFNLSQNYFLSIGQNAVNALYMEGDQLHPNRKGAEVLADLVSKQVKFNNSSSSNESVREGKYRIKNLNSGLYLDVTDGKAVNKTNVQQWAANSAAPYNTWNIKSCGNGYYKIYSAVGHGEFLLDLYYGKSEDGTNIQIHKDTNSEAQQFKFVKADNNSYIIYTKASNDTSCLDVYERSTSNGANVCEWTYNGGKNQMWILEEVR